MAQRKRNKALDGLATLKASGALSATFHPDGTVASVVFGAPPAAPVAPSAPSSANIVQEILSSRKWPKTDVDSLDDLPSYDGDEN